MMGVPMTRLSVQKRSSKPLTPLGILAGFMALTEAVLAYALTHVSGGIQVALTSFVVAFPLLLAVGFFSILWNRPYVFYAPSEYGNIDPQLFMSAIRDAPLVVDQVKLAKTVEDNPDDLEARFSLIDTMADDVECQALIMMYETGRDLPSGSRYVYRHTNGTGGSGSLGGWSGKNRLEGTGLVVAGGGGRVMKITNEGRQFAQWLINRGRKCDFFWTQVGGWGTAPPGSAEEKWLADAQARPTVGAVIAAQQTPKA
jgi:hypothetical protein